MIYVYGVIDLREPVGCELLGLEDQPVQFVSSGPIAAICTQHTTAISPTPQNLWRHEKVLESLLGNEDRGLIPARFGTTFPAQGRLQETLHEHRANLMPGLDRVRGCVEVGLRIVSRPSAPIAPITTTSGRDYMLARLADERTRHAAEQKAEHIAARVNESVAPVVRDSVVRMGRVAPLVMSAAYLVRRANVADVSSRIDELSKGDAMLQFLCTGPWPAYHFAPVLHQSEAFHA